MFERMLRIANTLRIPLIRNGWWRWRSAAAASLSMLASLALAYDTPRINTLYHFTRADFPSIGNFEVSQLIQASNGDFYGVSAYGGSSSLGFVYRVSRSSGLITHLHDFGFSDGATPRGKLVEASDGYLYGTTEAGGANRSDWCYLGQYYGEGGCGTLFKVGLNGGFTKVHDFYSPSDGYQSAPSTGLIQASDGNFYGMAMRAYPSGTSSLFKMTPAGVVSVHHLFPDDESQGYQALAGLIQASDGKLYGTMGSGGQAAAGETACGTVFRAGLDGSFSVLHTFTGSGGDGCTPWSPLIEHRNGWFYATTNKGGHVADNCRVGGCGTIYRIANDSSYQVLHAFVGTSADGEYPRNSGLVEMPDGSLYGALGGNPTGDGLGYVPLCTTSGGATSFSCGTLYRLGTDGQYSTELDFGSANGAWGLFPQSTLILATDGNLYGTSISGGGWGYGTIYRYVFNSDTPIVSIDALDPAGGAHGSTMSLLGVGFSGATQVTFGNGTTPEPTSFTVVSDTRIDAVVPADAQSSAPGVTAPNGTTYSQQFFYLTPEIDFITPTSGRVGTGVTLVGAHFDTPLSISFTGGVAATDWFYVTSDDTQIVVTVPAGAQSGPITVTNAGGSVASETFTVRKRGRGRGFTAAEPMLRDTATLATRAPKRPEIVVCADRPGNTEHRREHCSTTRASPQP